jgi:sugar lactone lactonase YvrE
MPAARRISLLLCFLLAPMLILFLTKATTPARASITASMTITPVANIPHARGITIDTVGNLYSLDRDTGTVYKITPAGQVSILADFPDMDTGYIGPVFEPVSGNIFIGKLALGSGNEVFKITPAGAVSLFVSGIAAPSGLAADGQGNLFVTSYTCPAGAVYKVTSAGVVSVFGTNLCHPDGVAIGPGGDLFIGDRGTHRIMRVPASGGAASEFAPGFSIPIAVAFDRMGRLFAADYSNGTIYSVDANGGISPFASGFNSPDGLAFDQQNQLYVANFGTNQIVLWEHVQPTITPIASILRPRNVTIDGAGNLYTMDRDTGIVYKITPAGQVSTVVDLLDGFAGYVGPFFDPMTGNLFVSRYLNGSGSDVLQITPGGAVSVYASGVSKPHSIAFDGQGNLFVSNYSCPGTVSKVTADHSVSVFATGLCLPDGLAFGPDGALFVGDRGTNQVMRVSANGGNATVFATGFQNPMALAFDRTGRLFVTNSNAGAVVSLDSSGVVSPFVRGLNLPDGLVFDQSNQLFIADYLAGQIVKVDNDTVPSPTSTATSTSTPTATTTPTPATTPTSTVPPIADRLTINGGALTTTSTNVRLDVSAANADGGQAGLSMSFSNDGQSWSAWESYAASTSWQLTSGDGTKTVYGRFKNSAGALSSVVSDTIILDTSVQSEYGMTINDGALYTRQTDVRLTISARPGTAEMQVSNDGGFSGATWEPYTSHRAWQITRYRHEEITRLVYIRFRDVDGNISGLYLDDIILDVNAPHGDVNIINTNEGPLLGLTATDDLSGVAGMRLSAKPDFGGASWEPFAASQRWDFGAGSTVYVQFRDNAGNESSTYTTSLAGTQSVFLPLVVR